MRKYTVCLVMAFLCVAAFAAPPCAAKMKSKAEMKTAEMAREPHHMLAMAYRDNMTTFAKLLEPPTGWSEAMDPVMARVTVKEMRRSFDQMKQHCEEHKETLSEEKKASMAKMMEKMDTCAASISDNLDLLESEVSNKPLDAREISKIAGEIARECDQMFGMHGKDGKETMAGKRDKGRGNQ